MSDPVICPHCRKPRWTEEDHAHWRREGGHNEEQPPSEELKAWAAKRCQWLNDAACRRWGKPADYEPRPN